MMGSIVSKNCLYEVYACYHNDEIVYIGSGKKGRNKHCMSGISQNYDLNKLHFTDKDNVSVTVIKYFSDKNVSLAYEKDMIKLYKPKFNKVYITTGRNELAKDSLNVRKKLKDIQYLYKLSSKSLENYGSLVDEFVNHFGYADVLNKNIKLRSVDDYNKVNLKKLKLLTTYIRYCRIDNLSENNIYKIFYKCLVDKFSIDLKCCI